MPDAQATVEDAAAVAAVVHALVAWLRRAPRRGRAARRRRTRGGWRRTAGRAARWGMDAELADLDTGERDARARVPRARCSTSSRPSPERLGCAAELARRRAARGAPTARCASARSPRSAATCARSPPGWPTPTCPAATTRSRRRGSEQPMTRASPTRAARPAPRCSPRSREPPAPPAADPAARRRRPARRRGPPARALLLLRAALPRPARRRRALGVGSRRCSRCARALEERFEAALRDAVGAVGTPRRARGDGPRAARDRRRRRRRRRSRATSSARRRVDQVLEFLVHRSRLPAQGGRPALVGDRRA